MEMTKRGDTMSSLLALSFEKHFENPLINEFFIQACFADRLGLKLQTEMYLDKCIRLENLEAAKRKVNCFLQESHAEKSPFYKCVELRDLRKSKGDSDKTFYLNDMKIRAWSVKPVQQYRGELLPSLQMTRVAILLGQADEVLIFDKLYFLGRSEFVLIVARIGERFFACDAFSPRSFRGFSELLEQTEGLTLWQRIRNRF